MTAHEKLTGLYKLTHESPDYLPDKYLELFNDRTFELVEYEGSMAGSYQNFYYGNWALTGSQVTFVINRYKGFSNYLVDDILSDEERTTENDHHETIKAELLPDNTIRYMRGEFTFTWKKTE